MRRLTAGASTGAGEAPDVGATPGAGEAAGAGAAPDAAADLASTLPFARSYGDFVVCSGPEAFASDWLPPVDAPLRTTRFRGPGLDVLIRGTEAFFSRKVALDPDTGVAVIALGTPFGIDAGRMVRPQELLRQTFDVRLSRSLWGQFTLIKIDPDSGSVDWILDLQRSMSPWTTEVSGTRVALRFAPEPRRTGARLDPEGAAEFLLHGIVGRSGTPVRGWTLFPAGGVVGWSRGRVTRSESTPHPYHAGPESRDDPYARFATVLEATLTRALQDHEAALLPLTGGIDSRLLLAALLHAKLPVLCYTHGRPGCADDRVTQAYRRLLPLEHRFHAITAEQVRHFSTRVQGTLSLLGPDYDSLAYPHVLTSYANEPPAGRLFLAGVGTGIHKVPYMPSTALDLPARSAVQAIAWHYGRLGLQGILQPEMARRAKERMFASIGAVVAECPPDMRRVHVVQYYHLQERLGRWAGKGIQLQDLCGYDLCHPFLAPELVRESRRLGYVRQHLGQKIIRAIALLEPALLQVHNANGWPVTPISGTALLRHLPAYIAGARAYAYRRLHGRVAGDIAIVDYDRVFSEHYRDWVLDLLDPERSHLLDVVRSEALRALATQLAQGRTRPKLLGALAALELWCRGEGPQVLDHGDDLKSSVPASTAA